jgi:HK97 family phage major capsid protein
MGPTRKDHLTKLGHRKNGQPIYLVRGGAPRRKSTDIETEIQRNRTIVLEVADLADPTDDDITRQDAALSVIPDLESELATAVEREDEIQRLRERSADEAATEPGDQRDTTVTRSRRDRGAGPAVVVKKDEFEILRSSTQHMDEVEYRNELEDSIKRAADRYEMPDGYTGSLEKFVRRHKKDASWAKNILERMRPEYISAFEKVVIGTDPAFLPEVERAAMAVGTNTAGGHLVPTHLDPTLILTNTGAKDVVRSMSRVVTLTGGANKWNGVSTAGSTASWDAELTEVSDDTPAIAPIQIPVHSAKSLIQASIEAFEDITGLAGDVQMLLSDSKTRLEAAAHMTGSGSGQPTGIFTALDANTNVEISLTTGSTFTRADLAAVANSLGDRWTDGAEWLMHPAMAERIAALGTALGASYSVDMTQKLNQQLLGFPLQLSFTAPNVFQTTTIDNLLVFGLFSNFVIVDKPGSTSIEFIPHLFNTSNNLPDGRRAWYMHFRNGSDSVNDLAFRLLQDKTTA